MYPTPPSVWLMPCVTPSLPLAPRPVGHSTVLPADLVGSPPPTVVTQSGLALVRYVVKMLVVPEPSDRCTTLISVAGRVTPALAAAIDGSFHFVILPSKMPAMISAVILSGAAR